MSREKNLSTIVKGERVRVQMNPGRIVLKPKDKAVVELRSGGFDKIDTKAVAIEAEGDHHMGTYSRLYDLSVPEDRATIELLQEKLIEFPHWASHEDYRIKIVGEFDAAEPFPGYDDLDAEGLEGYWSAMPDRQRAQVSLEGAMKHELSRKDEDGNDITDKAKVDVLNKLWRAQDTAQKDAAEEVVSL